jgi:hypothetical protein
VKRLFLAIGLASAGAWAQPAGLQGAEMALAALRPHAQDHKDTRGATNALAPIKHALRGWAEAKLAAAGQNFDEDSLNRESQAAAANAGLLCPDGCPLTALGYADAPRVHRQGEFVVIFTSVGIACGYDDSAYMYKRSGLAWTRIFQTEQNDYTKSGYLPQTIYSVDVSPPDATGARIIVSLGSKPGCSNAFQPLYYRLWRIAPGANPKLLLDASETAYIGAYPPARVTLSSNDVRVEFTAGGTGYGEGHQAERHFQISANVARQIEPIAPTPRDFVEEWLAAPWKDVAKFSESASLQPLHDKLHRPDDVGDFPDPPLQCTNDSNLWQIGIRLHGVEAKTYYLVRWRQPDHFTMAGISGHPLCTAR